MSSPVAARVAVDALGMPPRNYGHLIQMAARYARARLDGHSVVNRETGAPIALAWERGLENAAAPGTPPALLLAVPAFPAMLAGARYLGAFARPPMPPDVVRYHAFAAAAAIGARRIDAVLIVRENREHRLFLDRVLGSAAPPHRDAGGANPDVPGSTLPADVSADAPAGLAPSDDQAPPPPPGPIPLSDIEKPVQFRGADYEKMGVRLRYLNSKYDPNSWGDRIASAFTGGLDDPSRIMTDSERAEQSALKDKLGKVINDHYNPPLTPYEARLEALASSPLGAAAWLVAGGLGASEQQQDAALGTGAALEGMGTAALGARSVAGPMLNVPTGEVVRPAEVRPETTLTESDPARTAPQEVEEAARQFPPTTAKSPSLPAAGPETPLAPAQPDAAAPSELRSPSGGGSPGGTRVYDRLDDFEDFRRDGAYADDSLDQNSAARDYVMERQKRDVGEHLVALDARTNVASHAVTSRNERSVVMPEELEDMLRDPSAQFNLHHGHWRNTAAGGRDISQTALPGLGWMIADGRDGDISAARLTPEAKAVLGSADKAKQDEARDLLHEFWKGAYDAARGPMDDAVRWRAFTAMEADRIHTEIVNRALANAGLIEYVTTHNLPSHPVVDEMQRLANAEARKDVGQKIPELANVPDRRTQPMGTGLAMARISGGDADVAARRLGRAMGGRSGAGRARPAQRQEDPRRDQSEAGRPDRGEAQIHPRGPGQGAEGATGKEVAPRIPRVSGRELETVPRNYGHLVMMTARFARARLDGRTVTNRETGAPVALAWERGISAIAAPGAPAETLLAVPAIPEMLAGARYLGSAPDPKHRPDIAKVHGFASAVEIGGRPVEMLMVVRENRQGRLAIDRMERRDAAARAA